MRKIIYMYSSLARQFLILSFVLLFASRLVLFIEGIVFELEEFKAFNIPATIIFLGILIGLCVFLFIGQRFFYSEFSEHKLTYHNKLTRRSKSFNLDKVEFVKFMSTGVKLFYDKTQKPVFKIPFYRFGVVSPIGIDSFEKLVIYKNIDFEKTYTILPCYSRGFKFIGIAYVALTIGIVINALKIILLDIMIFQQSI